jgi:hypothetical protein
VSQTHLKKLGYKYGKKKTKNIFHVLIWINKYDYDKKLNDFCNKNRLLQRLMT